MYGCAATSQLEVVHRSGDSQSLAKASSAAGEPVEALDLRINKVNEAINIFADKDVLSEPPDALKSGAGPTIGLLNRREERRHSPYVDKGRMSPRSNGGYVSPGNGVLGSSYPPRYDYHRRSPNQYRSQHSFSNGEYRQPRSPISPLQAQPLMEEAEERPLEQHRPYQHKLHRAMNDQRHWNATDDPTGVANDRVPKEQYLAEHLRSPDPRLPNMIPSPESPSTQPAYQQHHLQMRNHLLLSAQGKPPMQEYEDAQHRFQPRNANFFQNYQVKEEPTPSPPPPQSRDFPLCAPPPLNPPLSRSPSPPMHHHHNASEHLIMQYPPQQLGHQQQHLTYLQRRSQSPELVLGAMRQRMPREEEETTRKMSYGPAATETSTSSRLKFLDAVLRKKEAALQQVKQQQMMAERIARQKTEVMQPHVEEDHLDSRLRAVEQSSQLFMSSGPWKRERSPTPPPIDERLMTPSRGVSPPRVGMDYSHEQHLQRLQSTNRYYPNQPQHHGGLYQGSPPQSRSREYHDTQRRMGDDMEAMYRHRQIQAMQVMASNKVNADFGLHHQRKPEFRSAAEANGRPSSPLSEPMYATPEDAAAAAAAAAAKGKRGRPRKHAVKIPLPPLYVFIRNMLHNKAYNPRIISWINESAGVFKVTNTAEFAKTWGLMKSNRSEEMNYEKMSRAMRYHYGNEKQGRKGHLAMVKEKRLVYRFGELAINWRTSEVELGNCDLHDLCKGYLCLWSKE